MKKELIFLGAPASGKGTQTDRLSKYLNFPHVDTGSLLRTAIKEQTPEGLKAQSFMDKGQLVPLEVVGAIIKNRLSQNDCKAGYILDGYPRSVEQADVLKMINQEIDGSEEVDFRVIYFDIAKELLLDRIIYRRSCPKCGKIYNLKFLKPQDDNTCECGTELIQRKDDTEEVAQARFTTYFEQTAPLIQYYEKKNVLRKIDANGTVEEVWNRLLKVI